MTGWILGGERDVRTAPRNFSYALFPNAEPVHICATSACIPAMVTILTLPLIRTRCGADAGWKSATSCWTSSSPAIAPQPPPPEPGPPAAGLPRPHRSAPRSWRGSGRGLRGRRGRAASPRCAASRRAAPSLPPSLPPPSLSISRSLFDGGFRCLMASDRACPPARATAALAPAPSRRQSCGRVRSQVDVPRVTEGQEMGGGGGRVQGSPPASSVDASPTPSRSPLGPAGVRSLPGARPCAGSG